MQLPVDKPTPRLAGPADAPERSVLVATLIAVAIAFAYFLAAHLGLLLLAKPENIAVFWPASGIAAGALVVLGASARLPVVIGVAVATLVVNVIGRGSPLAGLAFAFANAIECLLFAWIFQRFDRTKERLEDLTSVLVFLLGAAVSCAVAAVPAVVSLRLLGLSDAPLHQLWLTWFSSDALGILAIAPVLLTTQAVWRNPPSPLTVAEACLALVLVLMATLYGFNPPQAIAQWQLLTPATLLFPLLLWLAGRTPAFFGALAAIIISVVVVASALTGDNGTTGEIVPLAERVAAARIRVLTVVACTLTLTAMFARLRNLVTAIGESDARLRDALSAAGMYAFDHHLASGRVHRVGSLIEKLGLPADSLLDDYLSRIHPDDLQTRKQMSAELTPAMPEIRRRLKIRAIDGCYLHIAHRVKAEFNANGEPTRRIGTCVDVSDQHKFEQALRESEELLRQALAAGRVYAFECDLATDVIKRSENAVEILGIPPDKLNLGREEFKTFLSPEDSHFLSSINSRLTSKHPFDNIMVRFIRPDGKTIWLEINERATFDTNGQLVRLSGLTRDVTSRKLAEQHQMQLIEELNHRVKNTLATVKILISRTRRDHPDTDDYMDTLLGRITAMERTHNRLSESEWNGVGLAQIVSDELAPYASAGITTCGGPEIKLIPAAAQAVCLTIHELATNAAKYGALSVSSGSLDVSWQIEPAAGGAGRLKLDWIERVPHEIEQPQRESYGTRTIRNALPHEFQGTVTLDFTEHGLHCSIDLPLDRIAEPYRLPELTLAAASSVP